MRRPAKQISAGLARGRSDPDLRGRLVDCLDQCISKGVRKGFLSLQRKVGTEEGIRGGHPCSRIILPLTGRKRIFYCPTGQIREMTLRPGQVMFSVRYGWTDEQWDLSHTMISIVFHEAYTRVIYINNSIPRSTVGPDLCYHTGHGISEVGWHTVQALNALPREGRTDERTLRGLLFGLLAQSRRELLRAESSVSGKARNTFIGIKEFLHEHYQEPINRKTVAAAFGLSPSYVSRIFAAFSDRNFLCYLNQLRLTHACNLLKDSTVSLGGIAKSCGFPDANYFIRAFKRAYGQTPGRFRTSATRQIAAGSHPRPGPFHPFPPTHRPGKRKG